MLKTKEEIKEKINELSNELTYIRGDILAYNRGIKDAEVCIENDKKAIKQMNKDIWIVEREKTKFELEITKLKNQLLFMGKEVSKLKKTPKKTKKEDKKKVKSCCS